MAVAKKEPVDKEKKNLSKREQDKINREYEKNTGKKLPKDGKASMSEAAYSEWKSTGKLNHLYSINSDSQKPKKEDITAKLPTKKLESKPIDKSIQKSSTPKKEAIEKPKFEPESKSKKLTKGSGRTGNVGTAVKNVVGKQVFKKEEKMAGAYNRATSAYGTGSQAGMNKADRKDNLNSQIKELKSVRKDVKKSTGYDVKKDIKDTKKALKWSEKVGSGNNRYISISGRKK